MEERRNRLTIQLCHQERKERNETRHEQEELVMTPREQVVHEVENDAEWQRDDNSIPSVEYSGPRLPFSHMDLRRKKSKRQSVWKTGGPPRARDQLNWNWGKLRQGTRYLFVISSAVLVGLLFGFTVLSVFSSLGDDEVNSTSALEDRQNDQQQERETENQHEDDEQTVADQVELNPSQGAQPGRITLSYYAVQAGVFSDVAYAADMIEQYRMNGWPSQLTGREPYRLYVGVANTRQDALRLGSVFEEKGLEIYVREHILEKDLTSEQAQALAVWHDWLEQAKRLAFNLTAVSVELMTSQGARLTNEDWGNVWEEHRSSLQTFQDLREQAQEIKQLEVMMVQLSQGISALEAYRGQPNRSYIWQVQEAVLHFLQTYEELTHLDG